MDARAWAGAALVLIAVTAARLEAGDRPASSDTARVAEHLVELRAAGDLDEVLLLDLDELLADPVVLGRDDVARLRVLPWLNDAQIDALRAGAAPRSAAELAALPGWDIDAAWRTLGFIRFASAPAPRSAARAHVRSAMLRRRRDLLLDVSVQSLRVVGRWTSTAPQPAARAVELDRAALRVVAGDMRLRHAQGLLWWSGEDRFGAGGPALRSASGLLANGSLEPGRTVHGVGLELDAIGQLGFLTGDSVHGRIVATMLAVPVPLAGTLQFGWVRGPQRAWRGVAWARQAPRADVAVELAGRSGHTAVLAAAVWRRPRSQLRARIERSTPGSLGPWSFASATRRRSATQQALLQTHFRFGRTAIDLATAHAVRRDSVGATRRSREHTAQISWSRRAYGVDVRLRERAVDERAIGLETFEAEEVSQTRSIVVGLQATTAAAQRVGVEYRAVESHRRTAAGTEVGSAWVLRLQRQAGVASLDAIVATYSAPSGYAAPYVPQPYVAGTFASQRLLGDGIRVALGLAMGPPHRRLRARGAVDMRESGRAVFEAETSLSVRLP